MNETIKLMLQKYPIRSRDDAIKALREIIQEIVLLGVWRTKLFEQLAFYGGTALRILYGLNRFSEDIDFTLLKQNKMFSWKPFASTIEEELSAYGFEFNLEQKKKSFPSAVQSAFLKTNTLKALLQVDIPKDLFHGLHPSTMLKIKIEIDTDPTIGFRTTQQILTTPLPVPITTLELPDMFASKLHAALFRAWKNRTKGRDWYDVFWYISRNTPLNLSYFEQCLKKNKSIPINGELTTISLQELIFSKIDTLDINAVKTDVEPFLRDHDRTILEAWNKDYFISLIKKMNIET